MPYKKGYRAHIRTCVKAHREARHFSLDYMIEQVPGYEGFETGGDRGTISTDMLRAIAKALYCDMLDLFEMPKPQPPVIFCQR